MWLGENGEALLKGSNMRYIRWYFETCFTLITCWLMKYLSPKSENEEKWRIFFTLGCTCWKGSSMEQKCSFEGYYWKDFPIATLSQSLHQLATKLSFFFKKRTIVGLALKPRIVSKGLASQSFRKCVFGTCTVAMFILFHSILFFNSSQLLLKAFPQSTDLST